MNEGGREAWREGDIPNDNLLHLCRTQKPQHNTSKTGVLNNAITCPSTDV